jgi:hypothetical protein
MAQKRMFDKRVVDSEEFYNLPIESQCLYFHLGMNADVKGFVQPLKICRLANIKVTALDMLIRTGFVYPFDCGVVVIIDWNVNNQIRSEREAPTKYVAELESLQEVKEGKYLLKSLNGELRENSGSSPAQNRIEENRIEQNRTENSKELEQSSDNKKENKSLSVEKKEYGNPDVNQAIQLLKDMNGGITQEKLNRYAVQRLITKYGVDSTLKAMQFAYKVRERQFAPLITNYIQLERKYPELTAYAQRLKDEKQNTTVAFYVAEAEEGGVVYG